MKLNKKYLIDLVLSETTTQTLATSSDKAPIEEKKTNRKVDSAYLRELIVEVMEENFGEPGVEGNGDLLHEAWDSGWPSNFEGLRAGIKEFTTKGKNTEDILSKYAMEAIAFSFLNQVTIWKSYRELFESFASSYFQNTQDRPEDYNAAMEFIDGKNGFMQKSQAIGGDFRDIHDELGGLAALRVLNKMVSRLNKGVAKFWKSVDGGEEILEQFKKEAGKNLLKRQFQEVSLITSKLLKIIQFVNIDKGDDNTKKLADFYKMLISEGWNRNALITKTDHLVEVQSFTIDMTTCEEMPAGEPCVLHKFDDGYFWYDTRSAECDVSGIKLNNCGYATSAEGILYNLMSRSETGKPKWHVMLEYNDEEKSIVQVLGNSNSVPKEEHWSHIKWFYEKLGKPEVKKDAWEHVRGDNVKDKVYNFLEFLGLKPNIPETGDWSDDLDEGKKTNKLDRNYLTSMISEVMRENFGESTFDDGDLLNEAWDSGWPDQFIEMALFIKKWAGKKGKTGEDIISKYFISQILFSHIDYLDIFHIYKNALIEFADDYVINNPDGPEVYLKVDSLIKDRFGFSAESKREFADGYNEVYRQGDQMTTLRFLNKMIKSLDKKVSKFFDSIKKPNLTEAFKNEVSSSIRELVRKEISIVKYRLEEILNFINGSASDDNIKKLSSFYKKEVKNSGEGNLITRTNDWIADTEFEINELPCEEAGLDTVGCILHKFDDGYFWYNVDKSICKVSGQKMNNCGRAGRGLLVNLMSKSETGKLNWHVMVEYDPETNEIVQVLGNSNTLPKKEYWDKIKWYYENKGKPTIDNEAWGHLEDQDEYDDYDDDYQDTGTQVEEFLSYLGAGTPADSYKGMVLQIGEGFYNNERDEGEDWTVQSFENVWKPQVIEMDLELKMRITSRDYIMKWGKEEFPWLNRAASGSKGREIAVDTFITELPEGWSEFYKKYNLFRVKLMINRSGFMSVLLAWESERLDENPDGGATLEGEALENRRIEFTKFMIEVKRKFHTGFMFAIGDKIRAQIVEEAKRMKTKSDDIN